MSDYIRKAVELAEGWDWNGIQTSLSGDKSAFIKPPGVTLSVNVEHLAQIYIDALAAQLVRQVDAIPHRSVNAQKKVVQVMQWDHPTNIIAVSIRSDDRTMNTIKAIVDSGVLADMSNDLIERLHDVAAASRNHDGETDALIDAADTIERLTEANIVLEHRLEDCHRHKDLQGIRIEKLEAIVAADNPHEMWDLAVAYHSAAIADMEQT